MGNIQSKFIQLRAYSLKLMSIDGDAHQLALAFSLGVLISFCPLYGIHSFIALACAATFRLNLPILMAGAWVNLPIIAPAVYYFCYWLGQLVIGGPPIISDQPILEIVRTNALPAILQLTVGCFIVGMASAFIAYVLFRQGVKLIRLKRRKKNPKK